jgi:hypothetical protein
MKCLLLGVLLIGPLAVCPKPLAAADNQTASPSKSIREFGDLEKMVWKHFKAKENFRPKDLIAQEDLEPLLKELAAAGFTLKKPDELSQKLLSKGDFIYVELSTPAGRKFMGKIASYPNGYDRLERLSRLPRGQQTIRDLIRGPGGEKMIEYMTTSAGGKELGIQLSQAPNGADFNAITGRIYTVSDLLGYLKKKFDAQKSASN